MQVTSHPVQVAATSYLVPEDSDGAGGGHLAGAEPDRGDARGHAQDKDLRQGADHLPQHGDRKELRPQAAQLHPGAQRVEGRAQQGNEAQSLLVQQPGHGEEQRDVDEHVAHGQPVDGKGAHAVEAHEDVVDAAVLDPLEGVAQGVAAEEQHHGPAPRGHPHLGGNLRPTPVPAGLRRPAALRPHHADPAPLSAGTVGPEAKHLAGKPRPTAPASLTGCHRLSARARPSGEMLSCRLQCALALLSIALAVGTVSAAPSDPRLRQFLQKSLAAAAGKQVRAPRRGGRPA